MDMNMDMGSEFKNMMSSMGGSSHSSSSHSSSSHSSSSMSSSSSIRSGYKKKCHTKVISKVIKKRVLVRKD